MTTEQRDCLEDWERQIKVIYRAHYICATRNQRKNYLLGIPVVVLSAIVGASVFASLGSQPDKVIQIIVGSLSIAATVLASLQTFLRFEEKSEKHKDTGAKFAALHRELEQFISKPDRDELETDNWMAIFRDKWDKTTRGSLTIPQNAWNKAFNRTKQERKQIKLTG